MGMCRFKDMLELSPVNVTKQYYWWRAQTATYIVRPNERTLKELASLRQRLLLHPQATFGKTISVRENF